MAKPMFDSGEAGVGELGKMIEVVGEGTVSKTLLEVKTAGGGVVKQILFGMDAGQELSEHRTPAVATIQVLEGRLWVKVGEKEFTLEAGGWVLMPGDVSHAVKAEQAARFLLTMIR